MIGTAGTLAGRTLVGRAAHRDLRPGGRIDRLAALVGERDRLVRLEGQWNAALGLGTREQERATVELIGLRDKAERAGADFTRALGAVYADPAAAAHAFARTAVREGPGSAAGQMASVPESFGVLRAEKASGLRGAFRPASDRPARTSAPMAAERGAAYVRANDAYVTASRERGGRSSPSPLAEAAGRREARARAALFPKGSGRGSRGRVHALDGRIGRAFRRISQAPGGVLSKTTGSTQHAARVAGATTARLGSVGLGVATAAARSVVRGLGR